MTELSNGTSQTVTHRSDNVRAKHPVSLLVGQHLHEAVGVVVGLGPAVGHEGELAHVVLDALALEVLLVLAHPRNLGVRVDDGGHAVVVDVHGLAHHPLARDDGLVLGLGYYSVLS